MISSEIRASFPGFSTGSRILREPASTGGVFLADPANLLWYEAFFTPVEEPTYIVSLRLFAIALPDFRCQFSGEVRTIELPELELVE